MRGALFIVGIAGVLLLAGAVFFTPPPPPLELGTQQPVGSTSEYSSGGIIGAGGRPRNVRYCTQVLALDGGGMRGLVPALLLAEIERRTGRPIADQFDLIAGTSTGAIITLGLTVPNSAGEPAYSAQDIADLYQSHGETIFPSSWSAFRAFRKVFAPKYLPSGLESVLREYFAETRLYDATKPVLISGYDIEDERPLWFSNMGSGEETLRVADLLRGATAAPTFLPPHRFRVSPRTSAKQYVALTDGALFANNPALAALNFAQRNGLGGHSGDVLLLSVGTGSAGGRNRFDEAWRWGTLGWMDPLLEVAFGDHAVDAQLRALFDFESSGIEMGRYFRLQVNLGSTPPQIDDASPEALGRLTKRTEEFIEAGGLDEVIKLLSLPRDPSCPMKIGTGRERVR